MHQVRGVDDVDTLTPAPREEQIFLPHLLAMSDLHKIHLRIRKNDEPRKRHQASSHV